MGRNTSLVKGNHRILLLVLDSCGDLSREPKINNDERTVFESSQEMRREIGDWRNV